ncbi:MAG TPA: hypothetical protein VEC11_00240 [Allosphingosinicella sp.]|nr:hypothetical protein [Allosphingosinicella sp.]
MIRPFLLSATILLAGCARSEEARYAQIDNVQLPATNATDLTDDEDLTVGTWQAGLQEEQPVLQFGPVGAPARFSIGCDERRNLLLFWPGAAPGGDLPNMLVTVGSETRRLAVVSAAGVTPMLRGTLPPNDPFVRVLTGASTPIIVRVGDAAPLIMPPSPEIASYIRRCASGEARSTAAAPAGNSVEANGSVDVIGGNAATTNAQ